MDSGDIEADIQASGDNVDAFGFGSKSSFDYESNDVVARMPSGKDDMYYNMKHKKRGIAIIFNHEKFDIHTLKTRSGTNVDCEQLKNCLKNLGYTVKVYHDLHFKELNSIVQEAARMDHTDCDSFIITVLSHGEMGILYTKDVPYKPENLWVQFTADRCPTLAGKPKLFFIQACQGDKLDGGVMLSRTETDGIEQCYKIPTHADFLIAYSTVPGFYSWRNTTHGSWFMQALCAELRMNSADMDLLTLMTSVCRRVAFDYESNTPTSATMHRQKQIPCITSMLTRLVRFTPK